MFARGVEMIEVLGRLISNSPIKRDRLHVTRVENEIRFIPPWSCEWDDICRLKSKGSDIDRT